MKKILTLTIGLAIIFSFFVPAQSISAHEEEEEAHAEKLEYVLFHLETCPHCRDEIKFLNKKLLPKYGEFIDLKMYEVSDPKNADMFKQYGVFYNTEVGGVPMAFIGGEIVQGYGNDKTTGKQITEVVERELRKMGLLTEESIENKETAYNGKSIILPVLVGISIFILGLLLIFRSKQKLFRR